MNNMNNMSDNNKQVPNPLPRRRSSFVEWAFSFGSSPPRSHHLGQREYIGNLRESDKRRRRSSTGSRS